MGSYVQLGEVRTWYEEDGDGPPLVLLHPGGADSRAFESSSPASPDTSGSCGPTAAATVAPPMSTARSPTS
jgi:pimeloyl-ACP methyl ester carboxylesterase